MTTSTIAEFSVSKSWQSDRQAPGRWLISHVLRHKIFILGVIVGALGNAIGAGLVALYIGQGFDVIVNSGDDIVVAWTDAGAMPEIRIARIRF